MFCRGFIALLLLLIPVLSMAEAFRIGEVEVEGNDRVETSSIQAVVSVRPGEAVDAAKIDRDVREIFRLGRFEDVSARVEDRNGVRVLVYHVAERALVRRVAFSGNEEFTTTKLRGLISISPPEIHSPAKVEKSVKALKSFYHQEGYYAVDVEASLEVDSRHEATLTFAVSEGDKVLVNSIEFEGNEVVDSKVLHKAMATKKRWLFSWLTGRGTYREDELKVDLERIADEYYNRGYIRVRVKEPKVTLTDDRKYMDVVIAIEEGDQYRVGDIDIEGDLLKKQEELLGLVKMKTGDVFSRKVLRESILALNDEYADQGYAYVNVSPLTRVDPESLSVGVVFDVEQGVQVSIDRIQISGNTKTRDKVIRRQMKIVEGDLYSASKLKESRRRVNNLGFFEEVNVTTARGKDDSEMELNVEVKERPTGTFSLGAGYSSVDGIVAQGSIAQDNFLGYGWKLNLAGSFGGRSTTYQVGLYDPYFLDTDYSLGFDIYRTRREWTDFTQKTTGGAIKFGMPINEDTRANFVYRYEQKEILDVDATATKTLRDQEGNHTTSSIYAAINRNTTDYHLDPSSGYVSEASIEYAGLGGTEKFAKYILDYRHFFPFKWGTVFSVHGQMGYLMKVSSEEIPVDERFYLGGINSMRGFKSREVGPYDVDNDEYTGGDKSAYMNLEYVFPLLKDMGLKGVVFFDAGNAWDENEEYFSTVRYSAGGGIRWLSPMGPLRLEYGYNLDPEDYESDSQFEFSIGKFY